MQVLAERVNIKLRKKQKRSAIINGTSGRKHLLDKEDFDVKNKCKIKR